MTQKVIDELNKVIVERSDRMNDAFLSDWQRMDAARTVIKLISIRREVENDMASIEKST